MQSPAGSDYEARAARMREEMGSENEFGGCESPHYGAFGSQSPTFSAPSTPASPTLLNKPYVLIAHVAMSSWWSSSVSGRKTST